MELSSTSGRTVAPPSATARRCSSGRPLASCAPEPSRAEPTYETALRGGRAHVRCTGRRSSRGSRLTCDPRLAHLSASALPALPLPLPLSSRVLLCRVARRAHVTQSAAPRPLIFHFRSVIRVVSCAPAGLRHRSPQLSSAQRLCARRAERSTMALERASPRRAGDTSDWQARSTVLLYSILYCTELSCALLLLIWSDPHATSGVNFGAARPSHSPTLEWQALEEFTHTVLHNSLNASSSLSRIR